MSKDDVFNRLESEQFSQRWKSAEKTDQSTEWNFECSSSASHRTIMFLR